MPREFSRSDRVSSQIQRELATILQTEFKDPRLGFVTLNGVEVSRDLTVAKIYFSLLNANSDKIKLCQQVLTHGGAYLRRTLSKKMRMRSVPELRFLYDDSIERGIRMDSILDEITHGESSQRK